MNSRTFAKRIMDPIIRATPAPSEPAYARPLREADIAVTRRNKDGSANRAALKSVMKSYGWIPSGDIWIPAD
jgi:hypothetical protein